MKRDNHGFTLVELLVVVAIIGILSAVIVGSIATAKSADSLAAANRLNAFVSRTRMGCMGRQAQVCMTLTLDSNDCLVASYYENVTSISELKNSSTPFYTETIGGSGVSLQYTINSTTSYLGGAGVAQVILQFDRNTGALTFPTGGDIVFTLTGGGRSHTVTLYADTGSHKVD